MEIPNSCKGGNRGVRLKIDCDKFPIMAKGGQVSAFQKVSIRQKTRPQMHDYHILTPKVRGVCQSVPQPSRMGVEKYFVHLHKLPSEEVCALSLYLEPGRDISVHHPVVEGGEAIKVYTP